MVHGYYGNTVIERFEDTIRVIRSRKSKVMISRANTDYKTPLVNEIMIGTTRSGISEQLRE
jgi:hypothetical protein